jgi:hypothetical protein
MMFPDRQRRGRAAIYSLSIKERFQGIQAYSAAVIRRRTTLSSS